MIPQLHKVILKITDNEWRLGFELRRELYLLLC